jgi:hypothetical protein
MSHTKVSGRAGGDVAPMSIEELEAGLTLMDSGADQNRFWDENVVAFRQTVLLAIRETSDALLSPTIQRQWRMEMEAELQDLLGYLDLANRHIALLRRWAHVSTH